MVTKLERRIHDRPTKADYGYGGHERGNEAADRIEREAYPNRVLRSGYTAIVGNIPTLGPRDYIGARVLLERIRLAIEHGGWTRNEWRRLRGLESKWADRAAGRDHRFNLFGNRKSGLTKAQLAQVREAKVIKDVRKLVDNG